MTKREMFEAIKALTEVSANQEMVNFINHEIELLDKKASKKSKREVDRQEQNVELGNVVLEVLADMEADKVSVTDLAKMSEVFKGVSGQKLTYILTALVKEGKVEKVIEKRRSFYRLPMSEDVE